MSYESLLETVAFGVDVVVAYFFYKAYRSREKDADIVSNAVSFVVGDDLRVALDAAPNKCISYACVSGITESSAGMTPLKSRFTNEVGVVRHELFVEHKSKRTQGFWSDVRRVIKDIANLCPFGIVNPDSNSRQKLKVEVTDPFSAEYFFEHLPITYDHFDETQDGFLSRTLDRLFGEVTKGYQETERMLGVGVPIVGLGMLSLEGKRIVLRPPEEGQRYIITTMSKSEVVRLLRSNINTLKICFWICAAVGAGIFGFAMFRFIRRRIALERNRRWVEELRGVTGTSGSENGNQCVICTNSPREIVILNCGHVCLCSKCAMSLPEPRVCPICRSDVDRYIPIYIS